MLQIPTDDVLAYSDIMIYGTYLKATDDKA